MILPYIITLSPLVITGLNGGTLLPLHLPVANIIPERTQTAESNDQILSARLDMLPCGQNNGEICWTNYLASYQ